VPGADARSAGRNEEPGKLPEAANITNEIGLMVQKNSFFLDICTRTNGNGV
jgi:hypothetical protein